MKILYAHLGLYTKTLAILPSPKDTLAPLLRTMFSLPPAISLTLKCTFQKMSPNVTFPRQMYGHPNSDALLIPPEHSEKFYPRPYHPDCKCQFWNSNFLKELKSKLLEPSSVPGMQGVIVNLLVNNGEKSLIFQELTCKRQEKEAKTWK